MMANTIERLFAKQTSIKSVGNVQTFENIVPTYAVKDELLNRRAVSEVNLAEKQTTGVTYDYTIVSLDDTLPNQFLENSSSNEIGKYFYTTLDHSCI